MKRKFSIRIMGVGLTLALLTSLLVGAAPTPASATALYPYEESNYPKIVSEFLVSVAGLDIVSMAVNGDTVYVASGTSNLLYKSVDGGKTWNDLGTTTDYPTGVAINKVAVAPDNKNIVAMVTANYSVFYSTDGGNRWSNLGIPGTTGVINAVDVSAKDADGYNHVAAGGANATGVVPELWTMKLAMAENWLARSSKTATAGNFTAGQTAVYAVKFSPNYVTDKIITVVSGASGTATFQCFRNEVDAETWNGGIAYFTSWRTVNSQNGVSLLDADTAATTGDLAAASIALAPTFDGTDEGERVGFVGIADSGSGGGAVRVVDNYVKGMQTWSAGPEGPMGSIAYHKDGKVLAGNYNASKVYIWLDPMATDPKSERINTLKQPGGDSKTLVAWSGTTAIAGTSGDESAFAVSTDDAYSFTDISLIDTSIAIPDDIAPSDNGTMLYLSTHDSTGDASVWLKESDVWSRVLSVQGLAAGTTAQFILRTAPEDFKTVYVSSKSSQDIWVSKTAGKASWKAIPCYKLSAIQDFVVESTDVVYAIDGTSCSKTINAGASWNTEVSLDLGGTGRMIALALNAKKGYDVLVGGVGYVSFSKDAGATFTKILDYLTDVTKPCYVIADVDYAKNNMLYVANGNEMERGKCGETETWTSRETDEMNATTVDATSGALALEAFGIAIYGKVLYGLYYDSVTDDSYIWRALNFETGDTSALCLWGYNFARDETYNATPQALKISPNFKANQPKFWMIDRTLSSATDLPIESWEDPIATAGPAPVAPKDKASVTLNPETGKAYNVTFTVTRFSSKYITDVRLQLATDKDFAGLVYDQVFTGIDTDTISQVVGPTGTTSTVTATGTAITTTSTSANQTITIYNPDGSVNQTQNIGGVTATATEIPQVTTTTYRQCDFMAGTTYYWRTRVNGGTYGPLISPWRTGGTFAIADVAPPVFEVRNPAKGATAVPVTPSFVWTEYKGAIGYEIMVAEDPTFAIVDFSRSCDRAFYQTEEALAYNTVYYWRVRGVTGVSTDPAKAAPGGPWIQGIFTTEAKPVKAEPPVIVIEKPAPPPEVIKVEVPVPQPQPIPSYLLWAIIGIGAVLIIALIVLIVRTRRVV